jgi:hypothetical protein
VEGGSTYWPENRIDPVGEADATRAVLESVLFFAHDSELVGHVFDYRLRLEASRWPRACWAAR